MKKLPVRNFLPSAVKRNVFPFSQPNTWQTAKHYWLDLWVVLFIWYVSKGPFIKKHCDGVVQWKTTMKNWSGSGYNTCEKLRRNYLWTQHRENHHVTAEKSVTGTLRKKCHSKKLYCVQTRRQNKCGNLSPLSFRFSCDFSSKSNCVTCVSSIFLLPMFRLLFVISRTSFIAWKQTRRQDCLNH